MRHLIVAMTFALACASPVDPTLDADFAAQSGEPVELRVGQAVTLDGGAVTIRFLSVVDDSRCPTSVVCVWQGDGAVELRLRWSDSTRVDTLHTTLAPNSVTAAGVRITLAGLAPYPEVPGTTPQGEYLLTLATGAGAAP